MPTNFEDELDPRSALPLSDEEIRSYYSNALRERNADPLTLSQDSGLRDAVSGDAVIWSALFIVMVVSRRLPITPLFLIALVVAALMIAGAALRNGIPIGPFTYARLNRRRKTPKQVDIGDIEVLTMVVQHISEQPIRYSAELQRKIESDRSHLADSIAQLDAIQVTLKDEIRTADDESMRLLLESKRDTALEALAKLRELDRELALQLREAVEAVKPVREMKLRFDRLRKLSGSLSKIQAAHGLLEKADQNADERRIELQVLRNVSLEAVVKLQDIQRLVEAQERARAELGI